MLRKPLHAVGDWAAFVAEALYWACPSALRRRSMRVPPRETIRQVDRLLIGVLPLLTVVLFFVGMILGLQLATILGLLGVVEYVADIVGISMVREMAPLLTGIVLSGYAGAAIAAELGSMRVSEEFAAMDALALHPSRYLVAPRIIAAAVSGPLITTIAMFVGICGGLTVAVVLLGMSPGQYVARTFSAISPEDVALGLIKGGVFAVVVASIASYAGARTEGGALGVGRATTSAVVKSIVAIIACDLFLTVLFFHVE